ncbi:YhcN/YlaJ family sporulation lipoprotein [Paenibacillus sp. RC67]|uniref:YhcN/YlaJ family sporulation lipoprotein n=1 Tax=Paenibacillus sp. RC67 TaxID=3039392 RepID=UPI0024ACF247|nr:YhcN/YlaJ family sporulation lipoprotein [Paenibacillus sp. RC67]
MRYVQMRSIAWRIGLVGSILLLAAGCNQNKNKELGAGLESKDHHALYDRSSLNNENSTLGVKPKWENSQPGPKPDNPGAFQQLDMTNYHLAKTFRFAPEISNHIEQMPGIDKATILITEANAYVAVVLDGHNVDAEAHPEMMANSVTPKGGVGLFGTGKGVGSINWTDPGGLSHSMASRIKGQVLAMEPRLQRVFVSANPNFVQRIRFYVTEYQKGVDLSTYMNEFNTMTQRVFPTDSSTRR